MFRRIIECRMILFHPLLSFKMTPKWWNDGAPPPHFAMCFLSLQTHSTRERSQTLIGNLQFAMSYLLYLSEKDIMYSFSCHLLMMRIYHICLYIRLTQMPYVQSSWLINLLLQNYLSSSYHGVIEYSKKFFSWGIWSLTLKNS